MIIMKRSCMNPTYGVTIGTLIGKEKMGAVRKEVAKKSKKK